MGTVNKINIICSMLKTSVMALPFALKSAQFLTHIYDHRYSRHCAYGKWVSWTNPRAVGACLLFI